MEDERDRKAELVRALRSALKRYEAVDLFLLAHGNRYVDAVREVEPELRARLRLVYNTGCDDASQGEEWLALGAQAYVAHPGDNLAPIFYWYFLPRWARGGRLSDVVAEANELTRAEILGAPAAWVIGAVSDQEPEYFWRGTEARIFGRTDLRLGAAPRRAR